MLNPLNLIPGKLWLEVAVVAVVASSVAGAFAVHGHRERMAGVKIGTDQTMAQWNADKVVQQEAALKKAADYAKDAARITRVNQENQDAKDAEIAAARADAARAGLTADRMLKRANAVAAAAGCPGTGEAAVACIRKAAASLADVFGRCTARVRQLDVDLDDARARGFQCQRNYDAAIGSPSPSPTLSQPLKDAP